MKISKDDFRPYLALSNAELSALMGHHLARVTPTQDDSLLTAYHAERAYIIAEILADRQHALNHKNDD